jgi:hypothetical protein
MTSSWIKDTWRDTQKMGLKIADTAPRLSLQQEDDIMVMDAFVARGFRKKELFALNWCCTYLQVLRLSDLADAEGTSLYHSAWECEKRDNWSSQYRWPQNKKPSANVRDI